MERKWQFKTKFRAKAFGWRGSRLAISRLKEAVSEIKAAAKSDPVAAGDGAVWLMERIWPAFQDIDTSSGALGTAVARTLDELIPMLIGAPAIIRQEASGSSDCLRRSRTMASSTCRRSKIGLVKLPGTRI